MKMTFKIVFWGGLAVFGAVLIMVVFIPTAVWHPDQTLKAHPYTDLQAKGRKIFYSNGCNYCHTQYVRFNDTAMGPVSDGGDYVFDNPMILGSERTGPDLSYIGRKRSEAWEIGHLKHPRHYSPMSIMPDFYFLEDDELKAVASYLFALGDRTSAQHMIMPPAPYKGEMDPLPYPEVSLTENQSVGWSSWEASHLQEGKELYVSHCLTCHGCAGNGLGHYSGTKVVTPANFKEEPFRSMPDEQWFWHVSEGIPGSVMPPWKASLSKEDRWKVIRYIRQIFADPVERDPDEGDPSGDYANLKNPIPLTVQALDEGKHIFIRECWICHGDAGRGHGIYRQGILPIPPDFSDNQHYGTHQNPDAFTDSDYFWRISEGLPWSAMPAWKLIYSENDRWKLVHYLRVNFTQTEYRPENPGAQDYPDIAVVQTLPEGANSTMGRDMYLKMCAHCHGLTGLGDGWDGLYLDVPPANFRSEEVRGLSDGDWFARVTYGVQNSAMPSWGEWMPVRARWNVIKFIQEKITAGVPIASEDQGSRMVPSVYKKGSIASDFATVATDVYESEVHKINLENGKVKFNQYCLTCHGDQGQGQGPGTIHLSQGGPAPFPANMGINYILWRTWKGVPDTLMAPFSFLFSSGDLTQTDLWDISAYVDSFNSSQKGDQK